LSERRAGVIAVAETGECGYVDTLRGMLREEPDETLLALLLQGLRRLEAPDANEVALAHLGDASERVRMAALGALQLDDLSAARGVVQRLGDASDAVRDAAIERLGHAPIPIGPVLAESLTARSRRVREGIFHLVQTLQVSDVAIFEFCRDQLRRAYEHVAEVKSVEELPVSGARDLLAEHLDQKRGRRVENVMRTLVARDPSGEMRAIWRGTTSDNARRRANSLEALETRLDRALACLLLPMLESVPLEERLRAGQKMLGVVPLPENGAAILSKMLAGEDPVAILLALQVARNNGVPGFSRDPIRRHADSNNDAIRRLASELLGGEGAVQTREESPVDRTLTVAEKIVALRGVEIFAGLSVAELTAVASVTEEVAFPAGEVLTAGDQPLDGLHLVVDGEVIIEGGAEGERAQGAELTRFGAWEALGLATLFDEATLSVQARTAAETRFLRLSRDQFEEIAREYPEVSLHICRVLSRRLNAVVRLATGASGTEKR
jgi:hypothetical protein